MNLYLATTGDQKYLVVAESREKAADAMSRHYYSHVSIVEVPPNVKLPIVAKVVQYAK